MKIILNQDVPNLGEIGDVKDVAPGYARNYLFPRGMAFIYSERTIALFEKRKSEIETMKSGKRQAALSLKEKLEAEDLAISMPAGANGKLYGAVTATSIADELLKRGIEIERKRIEVPGHSVKSVGNYKIAVRLYEKEEAILRLVVTGHAVKTESSEGSGDDRPRRERVRKQRVEEAEPTTPEEQAAAFEAAIAAGHLG